MTRLAGDKHLGRRVASLKNVTRPVVAVLARADSECCNAAGTELLCRLDGTKQREYVYCEACLPHVRRERGLRAIEAARKGLAAQAAVGNDPRVSARAGGKRGAAISK